MNIAHVRRTLLPLYLCFVFMAPVSEKANTAELPTLGNASSNLVSIDQERALGSAWLRSLRGQVETYYNPIVLDYISQLIYSMAPYSQVSDRNFRFLVIESPTLNAFAVPGSIIGVNAGLFLYAVNEQEFASVMAHELSHLSQRHYARRLEQQRLSKPLSLAAMLASIVVAATTGSDAGFAALASTQAYSAEKALGFSRQNEQEADRIGIEVMYNANYDPRSMPSMFERMLKQSRLQGGAIPEYLSTHPLSENRVADTRNRASQYPRKQYRDNYEYHISRAMIIADFSESKEQAVKHFESLIDKGNTSQIDGATFGLAYSLLGLNSERSEALLQTLDRKFPATISIQVTLAEAKFLNGKENDAIDLLKSLLQRNPGNLPTALVLAKIRINQENFSEAQKIVQELARRYKDSPKIWQMLADIYGHLGEISQLHRARAEVYILTNRLEGALEQLRLAKQKANANTRQSTLIQERMDEVYAYINNPEFD